MTQSTTLSSVLALCGVLVTLGSGCSQKTACSELGSCGGQVPFGNWMLRSPMLVAGNVTPTYGSCSEDLYVPPTDPRLGAGADVTIARTPVLEPALYDWCDGLLTSNGTSIQNRSAIFYSESSPVGDARIRINADGTYSAGITRTGTFVLDFPALCMREFGALDGKSIDPMDPTAPTGNVCKQLEVPLRKSGAGPGSYQNTTCEPNPKDPAGCLCAFDVQETAGPSGNYQVLDSNTILFLSDKNYPARVTYCNKGNELELTGADGEYLFGVRGLRTLDLSFTPNCTDGVKGVNETGVDCGGFCPNACP